MELTVFFLIGFSVNYLQKRVKNSKEKDKFPPFSFMSLSTFLKSVCACVCVCVWGGGGGVSKLQVKNLKLSIVLTVEW